MSRRSSILAFALVTALGACHREEAPRRDSSFSRPTASDIADEPSPRPPPRPAPAKVQPEAARPVKGGDAGPATGDAAPANDGAVAADGGTGAGDAAAPAEASPLSPEARAMAKAVSEASSSLTDDPCEHSFNTLKALARSANRAVPRRADYLQVCGELSRDMQRCLDPAYRADNEVLCYEAHAATDRSILARLRRLVENGARE